MPMLPTHANIELPQMHLGLRGTNFRLRRIPNKGFQVIWGFYLPVLTAYASIELPQTRQHTPTPTKTSEQRLSGNIEILNACTASPRQHQITTGEKSYPR